MVCELDGGEVGLLLGDPVGLPDGVEVGLFVGLSVSVDKPPQIYVDPYVDGRG